MMLTHCQHMNTPDNYNMEL